MADERAGGGEARRSRRPNSMLREQHRRRRLEAVEDSVSAASPLLPVRSTLVAPILPEPISRTSPLPASRVSSSPNGIDPSR